MVGYNPTLSNVRSTVFNRMWTGKARLELEKVVLDGLEAPKVRMKNKKTVHLLYDG